MGPRGSGLWAGARAEHAPPNDGTEAIRDGRNCLRGTHESERLAPVTSLGGRDPAWVGGIEPSEYSPNAALFAGKGGKPSRSSGLQHGDLGTSHMEGENAESMEGRA